MISPFEYEISGPRDRVRSQTENLFTYSATEGNENFHKQELKLNYLI